MAITQTLTLSCNDGALLPGSVVVSGGAENNFDVTIAANATNTQVAWAWTNTKLESVFILSDVTLTLKTNTTSGPQDQLTITANKPFVWYKGSGVTNPFSNNVTTTYWTNATSGDADLQIRSVVDAP